MSKKTCEVIKDLLPLYAEGICSEESRTIVTRHLSGCSECSEILRGMGTEIRVSADRDIAVMKKIRRRIRIAKLLVGLYTDAACNRLFCLCRSQRKDSGADASM